jgi:type IV pilus assembly protein PilA
LYIKTIGVKWYQLISLINVNFMKKLKKSGFTLIEILIVIGIIAILASIVIIAINPSKQFAQARNTQRQAGVNAILNAIGQRIADNKGVFAGTFAVNGATYTCGPLPTGATTTITTTMATDTTTQTGSLGCLIPTYIPTLPSDPDSTVIPPATGFDVVVDGSGRTKVCASLASNETSIPNSGPICVTR